MAGSSNITGDESIIFADNASFDGTERGGKMTTDGQLWIGSTAAPHVRLGNVTGGAGVTITNTAGDIEVSVTGGAPVHGTGTDDHIVRWDGTGVPVIQDSPWTLLDNGAFTLTNGSINILQMATDGQMTNRATSTNTSLFLRETATTNAAIGVLTLQAESSGGVAASFGGRLIFANETATAGTINDAAYIQATWTSATAGAGTSRLSLFASSAGTISENLRVAPSAVTSLVNFTTSAGRNIDRTTTAIDLLVTNVMHYVGVTSTAVARTITLPITGNGTAQTFIIKDESGAAATNNITITCVGGATNIDGATSYTINSNYGSVTVVWSGSQYFII